MSDALVEIIGIIVVVIVAITLIVMAVFWKRACIANGGACESGQRCCGEMVVCTNGVCTPMDPSRSETQSSTQNGSCRTSGGSFCEIEAAGQPAPGCWVGQTSRSILPSGSWCYKQDSVSECHSKAIASGDSFKQCVWVDGSCTSGDVCDSLAPLVTPRDELQVECRHFGKNSSMIMCKNGIEQAWPPVLPSQAPVCLQMDNDPTHGDAYVCGESAPDITSNQKTKRFTYKKG